MSRLLAIAFLCLGFIVIFGTIENPSVIAQSDDDLIAQGQYIATIASCHTCHTPYSEEFADFSALELDDLKALALRESEALDADRGFSGGRPFDLGPQGVVLSRNITSDEETGIGAWTDEELERALRTGVSRDGRQLHPLMPYYIFNQMSSDDMAALIAFLRTIEPVENDVPVPNFGFPDFGFTMPEEEIPTPDDSDLTARGAYLLTAVIPCNDCHTPLNPETGDLDWDLYLGGGQPYEGPWGIVYGANITPHPETGLGEWETEDYYRAIASGVRPDGRRLVLMPWQDYAPLTTSDLEAVVNFLQNGVEPVDNEVPESALNEGFTEVIELGN